MKNSKPDYINPDFNFESEIGSSLIDELPFWSAPFGIKLLNEISYRKNIKVLDIGFGTGFPLFEIANRLDKKSEIIGIDPWISSHIRAKQKIKFYSFKNIKLISGKAEKIPLKNKSIDLIVSNNGINNVEDIEKVFKECKRIAKKDCEFIITINTSKTFIEFYKIFIEILKEHKLFDEVRKVKEHIFNKRKPISLYKKLFKDNNFVILKISYDKFNYHFADGEAFFNHTLIKLGFKENWEKILPAEIRIKVFKSIEKRLNTGKNITMTVPSVLIKARYRK